MVTAAGTAKVPLLEGLQVVKAVSQETAVRGGSLGRLTVRKV